jgi:putative addiction module antidote
MKMTLVIRHITAIGNSIGVTLPRDLASAYGLEKGALVTVQPTEEGLLLQPAKVVSALSAQGSEIAGSIIGRYREALDALAREDRKVRER